MYLKFRNGSREHVIWILGIRLFLVIILLYVQSNFKGENLEHLGLLDYTKIT